jgi:CRISPR-associated protein Cmr2
VDKERFIRAIAFCLAYDEHGGNPQAIESASPGYHQIAKWALSLADSAPVPEATNLRIALVWGGATRIKSYVFESARLPEIRGASGLLDRINVDDLPRLWEKIGGEDCVVYANGGEVMAFAPRCLAAQLCGEIERIYTSETIVAQSVASWQEITLKQLRDGWLVDEKVDDAVVESILGYNPAKNNTFGSVVSSIAITRFRRREANPDDEGMVRVFPHIETVPFARRCSSCERRGAVVSFSLQDVERPLCEPCARKRVYGQKAKDDDKDDTKWYDNSGLEWDARAQQSWVQQFERWLTTRPDEIRRVYRIGARASDDLGEIAQASKPEGFVGVVYADGNNMGAELEKLRTPSDYAEFASAVQEALRDAVFGALAEWLTPQELVDERQRRRLVHPFEILSIGGDDLFLIVPAHTAVPVACSISKRVERELSNHAADQTRAHPLFRVNEPYVWHAAQRCREGDDGETAPQSRVSLSVGVVLADAHTPVFYLADLAEQLLKSAKRRAKHLKSKQRYFGGTIDFLALKSVTMISGTIEQFRAASVKADNRRLYARPYTIAEMEAMLECIRILKLSRFPLNQLYRLRESLREGREQSMVDYLYFLSRKHELREARREIESLWNPNSRPMPHPWRQRSPEDATDNETWETIWNDLGELYDFVDAKE